MLQSDAAEFILQEKPGAVVVETAVNDEHGACTGNAVSLADAGQAPQPFCMGLGFHLTALLLPDAFALCRVSPSSVSIQAAGHSS